MPKQIRISEGEITIRFDGSTEAITLIDKLVRVIQFDHNQFAAMCNPPGGEFSLGRTEWEAQQEAAEAELMNEDHEA